MTQNQIDLKTVLLLLLFIILAPLLPVLLSRRWDWWEAWVYAAIVIVGFTGSRLAIRLRHPDLLSERARFMQYENAQPWDRFMAPLLGLGGALIPLAAGFEALFDVPYRFSLPIKIAALVVILAGHALGYYAMLANRFFSGMVRIQSDRGHEVVSGGPYRWMRHPGYSGALLAYWATPFLLDSVWALLPTLFLTAVLIARTCMEDRFLQRELPGYDDYARQVRYRLLPGIW